MVLRASRVFSRQALQEAWETVLDNDRADGVLSYSGARFEADAEAKLDDLAASLANETWEAGPLSPVEIPKDTGVRQLHIPRITDRIVARAILDAVNPIVDPLLGPGSYAYRPGLGVSEAIREVAMWRDYGFRYVARTDIKDCFPTLPRDLAARRLFDVAHADQWIQNVVTMLLHRPIRGKSRIPPGVPQGCPLSPLLANLVLVTIDEALLNAGFPVVRYADDLAIPTQSIADAEAALALCKKETEALGMELNTDKSAIMSFETGFAFLGEDFNPRYPPVIDRVEQPSRRALYAHQQGGKLALRKGRLKVFSKDETELLDVPQSQVSRLIVFGSTGISAGVRTWAMSNDVDVVMASRSGKYLGTMLSHEDRYRPSRLRAQLEFADSEQALELAKQIVEAKVRKQRVLLQRANRTAQAEETADAIDTMKKLIAMIPQATEVSEVLGAEGACAAAYFPALGALMGNDLTFTTRSRRPPMDVANAALSYLYTILLGECITALHAVGLDPGIGVLHAEDANRPSLALDLMEEFRPLVVDQCVWRMSMRNELGQEHGRNEGNGVLLTKAGRRAVINAFEHRMQQKTSALPEFSGTIRRHLFRQAQRLRAAITGGAEWSGLSWR
ncbi:MAG: CRISPR-associated endonuclease Cas1 [Actinomycetaceae bacterium]|nr:CRISPR-associated endonuclease Cas1 [Actinomycetaceae bacterium]